MKKFILAGGTAVFMTVCLLSCLIPIWAIQAKSLDPEIWDKTIASSLGFDPTEFGVGETITQTLETEKGISPKNLALSLEANERISETFGVEIGPGILLAIHQGETGGGTNFGTCSARLGAVTNKKLNPEDELRDLDWILEHWQSIGLRDQDSLAAKNINENYSDVTAHCGADAVGHTGFIATTGRKVCEEYLIPSGDPELATCNWFNERVAFHGSAYYLYLIDYRYEQTLDQQTTKLWGWNQDTDYDRKLANNALHYNQKVYSSSGFNFGLFQEKNSWKESFIQILIFMDLLPEELYEPTRFVLNLLPETTPSASAEDTQINLNRIPFEQQFNVVRWSQSNQEIIIPAGGSWSFCNQTNSTGWGQYRFTAGINAGGICANASAIHHLTLTNQNLTVTESYNHNQDYPFTTVVNCPGTDLKIKNSADRDIILSWKRKGDNLILSAEEEEIN